MEKDIIYNKSCVLMDEIHDESIRLIVTSPPYFNAKITIIRIKLGEAVIPMKNIYQVWIPFGENVFEF
tara:strand:- start:68 stop:271 length:204 start_codon:yes stop_codon:yes gene_type:complete